MQPQEGAGTMWGEITRRVTDATKEVARFIRPSWSTGAPFSKRVGWYFMNLAVVHNPWLPVSLPRVLALRAFGARIGQGVTIRPFVKVKFPWRLECGDGVSIGEGVWIDNLDWVRIGPRTVISQRAYLCTGNHDWSSLQLPLRTAPINIGSDCWIGADVVLLPGCTVGDETVVTAASVAAGDLPPKSICSGCPAQAKRRRMRGPPDERTDPFPTPTTRDSPLAFK